MEGKFSSRGFVLLKSAFAETGWNDDDVRFLITNAAQVLLYVREERSKRPPAPNEDVRVMKLEEIFTDEIAQELGYSTNTCSRVRTVLPDYKKWRMYLYAPPHPIEMVRDLEKTTENQLLHVPNLGPKCVGLIKAVLAEHNISLAQ